MELYGAYSKSIPQKTVILLVETLVLLISSWILFGDGFAVLTSYLGWTVEPGNVLRRQILFAFNLVVYLRMWITIVYLLHRQIPWEEAISIPFAFTLYYLGFALLGYQTASPLDVFDLVGIALFIIGSFLNTYSEWQRDKWKKDPDNKGHLYTKGLFQYAMHINYFGDLLWVAGYAILTGNVYSLIILAFLFFFFVLYNIPKLDQYLAGKYGKEFETYRQNTAKLIPFLF